MPREEMSVFFLNELGEGKVGREELFGIPGNASMVEVPWQGARLGHGAAAGAGRSRAPSPALSSPWGCWLGGSLLLWFPGGNISGRARRWHVHGEHVHPHLQATLQGWRDAVSSPSPSLSPIPPAKPSSVPHQLLLPFNIHLAVPDVGQALQH